MHYDHFGKCYSLSLDKVGKGDICISKLYKWSHLLQNVQKWTITYIEVETLIHTYVYVHYPGHVSSTYSPVGNMKINLKYPSQFHIPTTLSPRDRGFTYPGVKQTVKVDHIKLVDTLEEYSKYPCNKSMTGMYDECAYREVGRVSCSCYVQYSAKS